MISKGTENRGSAAAAGSAQRGEPLAFQAGGRRHYPQPPVERFFWGGGERWRKAPGRIEACVGWAVKKGRAAKLAPADAGTKSAAGGAAAWEVVMSVKGRGCTQARMHKVDTGAHGGILERATDVWKRMGRGRASHKTAAAMAVHGCRRGAGGWGKGHRQAFFEIFGTEGKQGGQNRGRSQVTKLVQGKDVHSSARRAQDGGKPGGKTGRRSKHAGKKGGRPIQAKGEWGANRQ